MDPGHGARVLVLFTVEMEGGRLRGKEEGDEALPSAPGLRVAATNAVPFLHQGCLKKANWIFC